MFPGINLCRSHDAGRREIPTMQEQVIVQEFWIHVLSSCRDHKLIVQDRVQRSSWKRGGACWVREQIVEVVLVFLWEQVRRRIIEQTARILVPRIVEEIVERSDRAKSCSDDRGRYR